MNKNTETETVERLLPAWIVEDSRDYFTDYACETHAREFATERGIPADDYGGYTLERSDYGVVASATQPPSYALGETDYPTACVCGQYLAVNLTPDGYEYLADNDFPEWVVSAYTVN